MKRIAVTAAVLGLFAAPLANLAQAEVNFNVSVGIPLAVSSTQGSVFFSISSPPEFIEPPSLGFYAAVGVPYDIYLVGDVYYLYRNRIWYEGGDYNGPWRTIERRHLPPEIRRHKHDRIRSYRETEYRRYRSDGDHYRGRRYTPVRELREERREELKDERREQREERKDERRDEHRREKEDRKDRGEERSHGHRHGNYDD